MVTREEAKLVGRAFVGRWRVHVKGMRHGLVHVSASERARLRRRAGRSVKTHMRVENRCLRAYPPFKRSKAETPTGRDMLSGLPQGPRELIDAFVGPNHRVELEFQLERLKEQKRADFDAAKLDFQLAMKSLRDFTPVDTKNKRAHLEQQLEYMEELRMARFHYRQMKNAEDRFNRYLQEIHPASRKRIRPVIPEPIGELPKGMPRPLKAFWEKEEYDESLIDRKEP